MTFALTKAVAYGIEAEEAVTKRFIQKLFLTITAANTDTVLDLGGYASGSLSTFWDAVDGDSGVGDKALAAIRDIAVRARAFLGVTGKGLTGYAREDASRSTITKIDSAASAGGAATETYTVTGLLTTDTILSVVQFQKGANAAYIVDFGDANGAAAANNALAVEYNTDVGAGAKVRVTVQRTSTTPEAGTVIEETSNVAVKLTYASGNAPTAYELELSWNLKDGEGPVELAA